MDDVNKGHIHSGVEEYLESVTSKEPGNEAAAMTLAELYKKSRNMTMPPKPMRNFRRHTLKIRFIETTWAMCIFLPEGTPMPSENTGGNPVWP